MALILSPQITSIATVLALALLFGKAASQNLDCPNGIINISAVTGQIAHPGSSASTYGVNEVKCWRIQVPDFYDGLGVFYQSLDIEQCVKCKCDSLTFSHNDTRYWGEGWKWVEDKVCGRQTPTYLEFLRFVDGGPSKSFHDPKEVYVRFSSDKSVNLKGFNMTFVASTSSSDTRSYLNASEDETIEFATRKFGIKKYLADYEEEWFLIVPSGRQVQITFEAFELELSEKCKNAFVEIREPYNHDGPYGPLRASYGVILAERMCGNSLPNKIQSTGNRAWVKFKTAKTLATTYKGFKASFKAVGGSNNQQGKCCDCKCSSGQGQLSTANPLMLVLISALLMITYKDGLF